MTNDLFDRMTLGSSYQRLFAFLDSLGVSRINVEYSGGGDSGGADNIEILPKKSVFTGVAQKLDKKVIEFIKDDLEEDLSNPIYDRHGSFADGGGYSVNGVVVYDVEQNKAWIEGTDHYYEYNESEDEDEEAEETCSDEDWDETLYNREVDELGDERTFDYAFYYAKLTEKQFPDVFHNQLAAAAIAGDEKAKEYMAWASEN